jgi:hypothetical protein
MGGHSQGACGTHEVLDGAAQSKMHLAAERVEGAEMASAICIDRNFTVGHGKEPGLRVVRAGRENGCAKRSPVAVSIAAAPLIPRHIRRPSGTGENTSIPCPIS